MAKPNRKRIQVCLTLDPDFVEKLDEIAGRCRMTRSEFIETFLEITLESQTPIINFAVEMKHIAKWVWPEKKTKAKTA